MGEVYRARDMRLGRDVAVKILPAHLASNLTLRERFDREARAVAALSHPHVCAVYDVGEERLGAGDATLSFLVMELLEGETLDRHLRSHILPPADVLALGQQIAFGLEAAHAKSIVHRDIKPGNIFLTRDGQVKITDFGLATFAASRPLAGSVADVETHLGDLTLPGSALGTAAYMSPEQARGEAVDTRTDIFAFGAVLFQMATGRPAFAGATLATVFDGVLNITPPLASTIAPDVPSALSQVIAKALEKDRERRYQRVSDLRDDLRRIESSNVRVPPVPIATETVSARKRPLGAGIGAFAALIAIVAIAVLAAGWYARRTAPQPPPASLGARIQSLAVLPLENLSERLWERLLHRRHDRRAHHRARRDSGLARDLPHLGDAIQERAEAGTCHRSRARRRRTHRRVDSTVSGPCPHRSEARARHSQRREPVGRHLRSRYAKTYSTSKPTWRERLRIRSG